MSRSVPIAMVMSMVFAWAVLWPDVARARESAPPASAGTLPAEDPTMAAAKQHFEAGRVAYNGADYPTAIREFKAAEAMRPSPVLSYNIGLANEKLLRRKVAIRYYKRYLEGAPAAANRAEVESRITQLEKELAAQPAAAQSQDQPQDNPPPPMTTAGDPNAPPQAQQGDPYAGQQPMMTAPTHRRRNLWWVWLIVGIGGALVVTAIICGVVFGLRANDPYYYAQPIDTNRLRDRRDPFDRNLTVPVTQRSAETLPLVNIRF